MKPPPVRPLPRLLAGLFLIATISSVAAPAPEPEPLPWSRTAFAYEVQLIPTAPEEESPKRLDYLAKQMKRPLSAEEITALERTDQGSWRRHTDELLAFDLPDEPALRVEVAKPEDAPTLRVVGGRVGTTDNRYERAYRLTVGDGVPYLTILVSAQTEFDDGICLCGAVAYTKRIRRDGQRMSFDLLDNGDVKRAQLLGAARAILIEWTHSAITQSAYARIAASLRFTTPSEPEAPIAQPDPSIRDWRRLAWLERGMDTAAIKTLLGPPSRIEDTALIYEQDSRHEDGSGCRETLRLPLSGGRFRGFEPGWLQAAELPPLPRSLAWARAIVPPEEKTPALDADKRQVLDAFLEAAPTAKSHLWDNWCQLASRLAKAGVKDPRVVDLVRRRFLESDLAEHSHSAAWVLVHYEDADRHDLFATALRRILENTTVRPTFDVGNLYSFLDAKHPEFLELMQAGLAHEDASLRADALRLADKLPPAHARQAARRALETEHDDHALWMAAALIRDVGEADDISAINARLARPGTSAELGKILREAIKEISARSSPARPAKPTPDASQAHARP